MFHHNSINKLTHARDPFTKQLAIVSQYGSAHDAVVMAGRPKTEHTVLLTQTHTCHIHIDNTACSEMQRQPDNAPHTSFTSTFQ
jgi:hypothetical protein